MIVRFPFNTPYRMPYLCPIAVGMGQKGTSDILIMTGSGIKCCEMSSKPEPSTIDISILSIPSFFNMYSAASARQL